VQWVTVGVAAAALLLLQGVLAALYYLAIRRRNVTYLVDFYSFRPPDRRAPSYQHSSMPGHGDSDPADCLVLRLLG